MRCNLQRQEAKKDVRGPNHPTPVLYPSNKGQQQQRAYWHRKEVNGGAKTKVLYSSVIPNAGGQRATYSTAGRKPFTVLVFPVVPLALHTTPSFLTLGVVTVPPSRWEELPVAPSPFVVRTTLNHPVGCSAWLNLKPYQLCTVLLPPLLSRHRLFSSSSSIRIPSLAR